MNKFMSLLMSALGLGVLPSAKEMQTRREREANNLGHRATPAHKLGLGGMGYTKASHAESKKRRKISAKSRKINWHK